MTEEQNNLLVETFQISEELMELYERKKQLSLAQFEVNKLIEKYENRIHEIESIIKEA